jgi:serine/threonine protein kinase
VLARYTIGRVLGKPGGFGITYLGFDAVLKRRVAIKELMPRDLVARRPDGETLQVQTREDEALFKYTLTSFLNEARLIAQFSHPNVVRVLDFFEANGTAYFAMEYYEGQTLAEYARRAGGRLPGAEAVALMLPLLDALEHIHTLPEPILHRDIKPANIYLTGRHIPILLDFGAARVAMGLQSRSLSAVLTPGFAPFEQYSTRGNQGPWSDVYGVAATLYFVVTGEIPPEANNRIENPCVEDPSRLAAGLPPHVGHAIVAGLGFKPADRPQSARAFADLLQGRAAVLSATPLVVPPMPAPAATGDYPPTVLRPQAGRGGRDTELAPETISGVTTERAPESGSAMPLANAVPAPPSRQPRRRIPLLAALGAMVLVIAAAAASYMASMPAKSSDGAGQGRSTAPPPLTGNPPAVHEDADRLATSPGDALAAGTPAADNRVQDRVKLDSARAATTGGGVTASAAAPLPTATGTRAATAGAAAAPQTTIAPLPPPPATPPPASGVLVVVYGDQSDGVRLAETAMLRSLVGRSGLQALDANSLSMMKGDQSALQAAEQGDFAALAALGRQHGVELMVVGDLRSRAAPSINRFFTGTAEISVKMYRVSNSRLVDTQTFSTSDPGLQPQLATSEGEARSKAATAVATAAAEGIGSWLGRAF